MRFLKTAFSVILICICLCACEPYEEPIKRQLGIDPADFIIVEEQDTHGGLLGDGDYYMILDCCRIKARHWPLFKAGSPFLFRNTCRQLCTAEL